jgi:hypothetical protein
MGKPTKYDCWTIVCPVCDEPCGRDYPETGPTYDSGGEPGFREGIGEDYQLDGVWYCSAECLAGAIDRDAE